MKSRLFVSTCALVVALSGAFAQARAQDRDGVVATYAPTPPVIYPGGVESYRDVTYAEPRGYRPLAMDLYLPPKGGVAKPVIVFLHGGAWQHHTARDNGAYKDFPAVLAGFAARGYVVASVNYRNAKEARFPGAVLDSEAAIRWLRTHAADYNIDPNRFVLWGSSAGGEMATVIGAGCGAPAIEPANLKPGAPSDCVQGVIDWYGVVDFDHFWQDLGHVDPSLSEAINDYLGCDLTAVCPAGLARSAGPFPYINAKTPPFLIQHGTADVTVSPKQSQRLYDALRAAGVPVEIVYYPGVAHGLVKPNGGGPDEAVNAQALAKVNAWLDHYFPIQTAGQ